MFNVTVLPCTTKSPPIVTLFVVVKLANVTLFPVPTPCIVPAPSNVSNLLSTEELNVVPNEDVNVSILLNLLFCAVFVVLLEPVYVLISAICPLTDAEKVLMSEICPSTLAVYVCKVVCLASNVVIEVFAEPLNANNSVKSVFTDAVYVCKVVALDSNVVILVFWEPLSVDNWSNLLLTLADVDSKLFNLN